MMRAFGYAMLTDPARSAALHAIIPADHITTSGNATIATPFIVIRSRIVTKPMKAATRQGGFYVHVHDDRRSYKNIDDAIALIDQILEDAVPLQWNSRWVSNIENAGWSEDLLDDHYGTGTRFGTFGLNYSA